MSVIDAPFADQGMVDERYRDYCNTYMSETTVFVLKVATGCISHGVEPHPSLQEGTKTLLTEIGMMI